MAIIKMKKLKLMVASSQREDLLRQLMLLGCVEVREPAQPEEGEESLLRPVDVPGLLQRRTEQSTLANSITQLNKYAPEKGGVGSLLAPLPDVETHQLLDESSLAADLEVARTILSYDDRIRRIAMDKTAKKVENEGMEPWISLELPMETTGTTSSMILRGTLPAGVNLDEVKASLEGEAELAELFEVSQDKSFRYMLLVCHRDVIDQAQSILRPWGFAIMSTAEYKGTPLEIVKRNLADLEALEEEELQLREKLVELSEYREKLKLSYDAVSTRIAQEEAESKLVCTERVSFLTGWLPEEKEGALEAVLKNYDCAYETLAPEEDEYPEVPVELKNGPITRSLNTVTEMYSLPAYDGIDPNPYMTPFFIFFYGMMMADMGYGILMVLICLIALKKKKPKGTLQNFLELFLWCGVSTIGWGAVTGGFFGDAPYQVAVILNPETTFQGLPAFINPLEDTVMILIGSVALGFVHIITGTVIGFVYNIKRGDWKTALNDQVAWWVVFAGIGCMVFGLGPWVLALGGALVVVGSFLTGTGAGKITGIFGALYSNVTGYFGDLLSYARLMALMLAGSVIAQVFNTLGAIPGNIIFFLVISIAGNALNLGLNLLGCFVHDLRLQCLEFFGKFYKDGGVPFRPLNMKTRYFNIVDSKEEV